MHQNIKRDQRVKNYLAACHLVENNGAFTLLIRVDVYMANNPLECRYWTQCYTVDDHVMYGEKNSVLSTKRFYRYDL